MEGKNLMPFGQFSTNRPEGRKRIIKKVRLFEMPFANIFFDQESRIIVAKWIGFLNPEDVRDGCSRMTEFIRANGVVNHLSDHRELGVLSKDVQNYLISEFFPEVEKAGLRKVGVVTATNFFAEVTVNTVNEAACTGGLQIGCFYEVDDCINWLLQS